MEDISLFCSLFLSACCWFVKKLCWRIPEAKAIRYLGVHIQDNLKWHTHIDMITTKSSTTLGFVKRTIPPQSRVANFQTLVWDLRLFVKLQTFLLLFYTCLKPRFFAHFITKPPASTLKFKNFYSNLQENFVTPDKNGKCALTQLAPPVPGQAYGHTLSTSRSFRLSDFFETHCWQPWGGVFRKFWKDVTH